VKIGRPDIVYRVDATDAIVNSPVIQNGRILTTPIINVPLGGAFRNQRRPDYIAGVDPFLHTDDKRLILNPAAFATPQPGTYGNLGRWALHGPNLSQLDLTLHKRIPIREAMDLEFRAEIYNILNQTNFANPPAQLNNSLGTGVNQVQPGQAFTAASAGGSFGTATSTVERAVGLGAQRQIQLSLRFNF
jgi:hypothetical protein